MNMYYLLSSIIFSLLPSTYALPTLACSMNIYHLNVLRTWIGCPNLIFYNKGGKVTLGPLGGWAVGRLGPLAHLGGWAVGPVGSFGRLGGWARWAVGSFGSCGRLAHLGGWAVWPVGSFGRLGGWARWAVGSFGSCGRLAHLGGCAVCSLRRSLTVGRQQSKSGPDTKGGAPKRNNTTWTTRLRKSHVQSTGVIRAKGHWPTNRTARTIQLSWRTIRQMQISFIRVQSNQAPWHLLFQRQSKRHC